MITADIEKLRDPFLLTVGKIHYLYGTGWVCFRNNSGSLDGPWEPLGRVVSVPEDAKGCFWAPEVHPYNGAYYMITTYLSEKTGHRGCTVMRAVSPEGPFIEVSSGPVTPPSWDSIDGTLYVDEEGQPWMVFVHEWTCTPDHIGRMAAAKLSEDLTHMITQPIELFRADAAEWATAGVTDGCWMYRTASGQLLMLWSNFSDAGYCVGIARSDNGKIDGHWSQDRSLLYGKELGMQYDGGHGMIFTDTDGQAYLTIHSPNNPSGGRSERPIFLPIREEDDRLICDLPKGSVIS